MWSNVFTLDSADKGAVMYALAGILTFSFIYWMMDMKEHFSVPDYLEGREQSYFTSLYTSVMAQNNAMPDVVPKSTLARALFMLQTSLGWLWFLLFAGGAIPRALKMATAM